jgi:hypothetical protein
MGHTIKTAYKVLLPTAKSAARYARATFGGG